MNVIWECLPRFIHHAFQDPRKEKVLHLNVKESEQSEVFTRTTDKDIYMQVTISDEGSYIQSSIFGDILELDKFELDFSLYKSISMQTFDSFFNTKSTLKEVQLRAPLKLYGQRTPINDNVAENHTFVEKLTILSLGSATGTVESILDRCCIAFPNLKLLSFDGFCGNWINYECLLDLSKFKLEQLVVNILHLSGYNSTLQHKFTIVKVQVLSTGKKYLYKLHENYTNPTKIDDQDLTGVECGKDCVLLHIIVGSLNYLKLILIFSTKDFLTKLDIELD